MGIKISACTITKNEEKNIAISINSYKDYVDEIIIVDTGSTDNTVEVAKSLGAKVINFKWIEDFSAAKNCALDNASGDWVLFLDADEWIKDDGAKDLLRIIEVAEKNNFGAISFEMLNLADNGTVIETITSMRLFKRQEHIRYKRKIHEILFDFKKDKSLESLFTDEISLNHSGYAEKILKAKSSRNNNLLERNFVQGLSEPIDYFYLAREHINSEIQYTKQFISMISADKDYKSKLKSVNIANNIENLKAIVSIRLKDEYPLEERLDFLEEAIAKDPELPTYYYHKYLLLTSVGNINEEGILLKALELDKNYKNKIINNGFYQHKADVFRILAKNALILNNDLVALNYYSEAIILRRYNEEDLMALSYIVREQSREEIIRFISSLFNMEDKDDLKYIVSALRLTKNREVFLYYFVNLYKLTGEVDIAFFTSRLFSNEFLELAKQYLDIYVKSREQKAQILVATAIIAGNLQEFYEENRNLFNEDLVKILNAFFTEYKLDEFKKYEEIMIKIIDELTFVVDSDAIDRIVNIFNDKEEIRKLIGRVYYRKYAYDELIREFNKFIEEDLDEDFAGEVTALLGLSYFKKGDNNFAILYLEQAMQLGYLNVDIYKVYSKLAKELNLDIELPKRYGELLKKFFYAKELLSAKVINDDKKYNYKVELEKLKAELKDKYNLVIDFADIMYQFADKNYEMKNFYLAEEYYKLLIKYKYNEALCYYKLGSIYDSWGFIEESYYCYEEAFINDAKLATKILPKEHKNFYYMFSRKRYDVIKKCPICGKEAELIASYEYLTDEGLYFKKPLISKYRFCKECRHIFSENQEITKGISESKFDYKRVSDAYDICEKLKARDIDKILLIDNKKELYQVLNKEYNIKYSECSLEDENISKIEEYIRAKGKFTLVTTLNNFESAFELCNLEDKPLWASIDVKNVFSKTSIKKVLENKGFTEVSCYDSKFVPGLMVVVANYESRG